MRRRGLSAFGIRAARPGQLALGALLSVGANLVETVLSVLFILATGFEGNVQATYQAGATAGALGLVLSVLAGALLPPLGEEFTFRGVAHQRAAREAARLGRDRAGRRGVRARPRDQSGPAHRLRGRRGSRA